MGIRIGRRLEELAARFGGELPKKKEPVTAPEDPDVRPKRKLVRDEEARLQVQRAEQQKIKEIRRAISKEETAQRSSTQKMQDDFAIQKLLENTDGSKLQQKRLKEKEALRKKHARLNAADLEARVEGDKERRIAPVHEFDRRQAQLEAEERIRLEAEEVERLERQAAELEQARVEQARSDAARGIYHEGNYDYLDENKASQDGEGSVGIEEADDTGYDDEPKQIGSRRLVQAEEDAVPRKDKPRARKSGVKLEGSYLYIPAQIKAEMVSSQKSRVQNRKELKEFEKMFGKNDVGYGAEPDYTAPEWVKFLGEMEDRDRAQEEADAEDLHEVYEILFDFYEGKDGKKGIAAVDLDDIIVIEANDTWTERYRNRWENITNPVVLEYPNEKGEKIGEVVNRYFDILFSFYRDNTDQLQKLNAVDRQTDTPTLVQQSFREIILHGDTYNGSLNIPLTLQTPSAEFVQIIDPVLRYLSDAFMKMEEHINYLLVEKLRKDERKEAYDMYFRTLKLLNDLGIQSDKLMTFRNKKELQAAA